MMKALKKKRKGGFTLIELIVVIAILGILAAIAIPRFANVTANATTAADEATARTIASAANLAIAENEGTITGIVAGDVNAFLTNITVTVVTSPPAAGATGWSVDLDPVTVYNGSTPVDFND